MIRKLVAPLALVSVAACGGNPFGGGTGGGGGDGTSLLPEAVSGAVEGAALNTWTPGDATLAIQMTSQDANDLSGAYARNAALDVGPYQAYTYQETPSNRYVVALVRESNGAAGMIAVDAGQFANYHGGGQAYRADAFIRPSGGGVGAAFDYAGTYVGLLNVGDPAPGGPGGSLGPTIAYRTTGNALITADFTDMRISGGVNTRAVVDAGGAALNPLADIALEVTDIAADGTFTDTVQRLEMAGWTAAGTYGGAFSGSGEDVAVVLVFNPTSSPILFEHGLIVLENCVTGGGPACPP